jgi:hypothetical protein
MVQNLRDEILFNAWDRNDPFNPEAPYRALWNGVTTSDFDHGSCPILNKRQSSSVISYSPCPRTTPACQTSTVQDCTSTLIFGLDPAGKTTTTITTGTCSPTAACSVTGFTSTVTSTSTPPTLTSPISTLSCDYTTVTTDCAGSGEMTACVTSAVCASAPPFPTLGSSSSPTDSRCISTASVTQCALGPGGQTACVANPTCVSWVPTASPTPTQWNPPAPTGGFWLAKITFPGATNFAVIPNGALDCTFLETKYNPIGFIVVQSDLNGVSGVTFEPGATFQLQGTGIASYYPLCGDTGLTLSFRPAPLNNADYG